MRILLGFLTRESGYHKLWEWLALLGLNMAMWGMIYLGYAASD
jgi:hypothetical protein